MERINTESLQITGDVDKKGLQWRERRAGVRVKGHLGVVQNLGHWTGLKDI